MIDAEIRKQYTVTIGIECHVQLKTKTKLFAAVGNDAREAPPNTLVSHICFGLPGALPVLNEAAVHLAAKAAFALGVEPQTFSKFDRKHYFYPDLPKGYQISQYDEPIILGGEVPIMVDGQPKPVHITRAHLEEDAGKSTHPAGKDYSLVDLNRAGTPLLEIVSEPDMHSAAEAKAYARELWLLMRYAEVSDANLYYGNMRFDVNVSVSKTSELGTRTETKNLNSFRIVEKAVDYEVHRQIELLEKGEKIVQETRGWDDAKQRTFSQRSKENADDYRYMPDPDIPPVVLDRKFIDAVKTEMPIMPNEWRSRLKVIDLDLAAVETLLDAEVDDDSISYLEVLAPNLTSKNQAIVHANMMINVEIPLRREGQIPVMSNNDRRKLYEVVIDDLMRANKLSSTNAKQLIKDILIEGTLPNNVEEFAEEKGYIQVSNEDEIAKIVARVLAENAKAADDVKNGELKAIGFLVGQVMKLSQGKANPAMAQELIKKQLGI